MCLNDGEFFSQGVQGQRGDRGLPGPAGSDGHDGADGQRGPSGTVRWGEGESEGGWEVRVGGR